MATVTLVSPNFVDAQETVTFLKSLQGQPVTVYRVQAPEYWRRFFRDAAQSADLGLARRAPLLRWVNPRARDFLVGVAMIWLSKFMFGRILGPVLAYLWVFLYAWKGSGATLRVGGVRQPWGASALGALLFWILADRLLPLWLTITVACLCVASLIVHAGIVLARIHWIGEDNTPLHLACAGGASAAVVRALVDAGVDTKSLNSDSRTCLHFAVVDSSLDVVELLIEAGAPLSARDGANKRAIDYCSRSGARALLRAAHDRQEAGSFSFVSRETMGESSFTLSRSVDTSVAAKESNEITLFLSHHKRDAAVLAVLLHAYFVGSFKLQPQNVFLDSNDLRDLRELLSTVKRSRCLVFVQTKDALFRPWILAELCTASNHGVPIVAVVLEGGGYDFDHSKAFLCSPSFHEVLEEKSPGVRDELRRHGLQLESMGKQVAEVVTNIISFPYTPTASEGVRETQLSELSRELRRKLIV